jgi:hypothetical protein
VTATPQPEAAKGLELQAKVRAEIARAVKLICEPGAVYEVRIPKSGRTRTVAGYFDDPEKLISAVEKRDGRVPAIYITLNPVDPSLLARAHNRLQEYAETATADKDILKRWWMLVDIDPKRPAGISSTDGEKAAAKEVALRVRDHLLERGWPAMVLASSGNGWHLLIRVDLPNDEAARKLVEACLKALHQKFSTAAVAIDVSIGNAARIGKLYGTAACKGDFTEDRPHRRSRLVDVPDEIVPVSRELLEALAAEVATSAPSPAGGPVAGSFDLDTFLQKHNVTVKRHDDYDGGHRWILEACPFNPEHGQGSDTAILKLGNGALVFKCQHNGCSGKGWEDFRAFYEPDRRPKEQPADKFEDAVAREAFAVRVRTEARRRIAAEGALHRPFDAALLADVADEPVRWRAQGLLPSRGRLLLAAQRKAGKTTAVLNLSRDLIVGGAFLGRFTVVPVAGLVAFLNFEVAGYQLCRWAREVGIPGDRLLTVHLRGRSNPFADPDDTARLAELMREYQVEVVIVDPFGRAYPGKSQNDAGEVGAWLSELDRFAGAAGCSELILTAHAGWEGERTRGTSALEDWADAVAYLVRDKEDDRLRYFRAFGRDVEVEEDRLNFDPTPRRLTLAGSGSRATARTQRRMDELIDGVVEAVTREPGATTGRLGALLREAGLGLQRGDAGRAARAAVEAGRIVRQQGPRKSLLHYLKAQEGEYSRVVPTIPAGTLGVFPTPPIRGGNTPVLLEPPAGPGTLDPHNPDPEQEPDKDDGKVRSEILL